ncbi:TetR family transcriptional regulator [Nocardia sp. NPDC052112]|uniref:TetR/AcrR family transcriptional regulator n=1 Tax=Nocardia sp. NPDC052112 TaxID=3155646 RepID=UPI00343C735E
MRDGSVRRSVRAEETRQLILIVAERLFAECGLLSVSNRQISEAAGQGNNAAVGYHFGGKADLVRAIAKRHLDAVEKARGHMVAAVADSADARDWVSCLVRPLTEHLAALGDPTWFARFAAQAMTDPRFREIMIDESLAAPTLWRVLDGCHRCLPDLPNPVRLARLDLANHLLLAVCAEREYALAHGLPTLRTSWTGTASGLIDAIVGILLAPVAP